MSEAGTQYTKLYYALKYALKYVKSSGCNDTKEDMIDNQFDEAGSRNDEENTIPKNFVGLFLVQILLEQNQEDLYLMQADQRNMQYQLE
jgi:hypothetical protein